MCRPYVHVREIEEADELLMALGLERLYGKEAITPNMHLHGHLKVNIVRGIDSNLPLHFPVADRIKTDDRRVNPEFPCGGCAGR